jgi:hypothetical protein
MRKRKGTQVTTQNKKFKLNQIVAREKATKQKSHDEATAVYHLLQKPQLFNGKTRVYTPRDDEGEKLPPESQPVAERVDRLLGKTVEAMSDLLNLTYSKDMANCEAKADIVVGDKVVLPNVPVTFLMTLEKVLIDFRTTLSKIPVLPTTIEWSVNRTTGLFESAEVTSIRSKKVPRNHVKAEATDKHPAQVEVYMEDVPVGTWTTRELSSAWPLTLQEAKLKEINDLIKAVVDAREEANSRTAEYYEVGKTLLNQFLGEVK